MSELSLREFDIREADWETDGKQLSNIRRLVFIVEQQVPQDEEWDGRDEESWHWLATDDKDAPIGTARLLPEGQIGRMAVLKEFRQHGVGAALLERAVEKARHLGMQEVFLNAQSHALGFYERCGFEAEGEEFMEAGIPHQRMTQALTPPDDNIQRQLVTDSEEELGVKPFDTSEADWNRSGAAILRIRRQVFQTELHQPGPGAPGAEDSTGTSDESSIHWIAENTDGHIVGAVCMTPQGDVSNLAVLDDFRGMGIGATLLELCLQRARRFRLEQVTARDMGTGAAFLEHAGFSRSGDHWQYTIPEEDNDLMTRGTPGEALSGDITYRLGEDSQLILLRGENDFRNVIMEMARQARQWIRIYSPYLDHALYDRPELMEVCSQLARRNKYTRVEILVYDPHRVIKNGHALLNISRRLPSSISIRIVDPEFRQQNHEYMLVDGEGVIYRQEYDQYEGTAYFRNITECNRLTRQFSAAWETGLLDPNLRQLRI